MGIRVLREIADDEVVVDAQLEGPSHALPRQRAHKGVGQDYVTPDELPEDGNL